MEGLEEIASGEVETKVDGGEPDAKVETIEKTPEQIKAEADETKRQSDFKALRKHNKEIETALKAEREARIKAEARAEAREELLASHRDVKPTLEAFGGDAEAYAEALSAYRLSKSKRDETETTTKQQREAQEHQEKMMALDEEFYAHVDMRAEIDDDLKIALANIVDKKAIENLNPQIKQALKGSPVGIELLKYLGLNPSFVSSLEELSLKDQAIRMNVLEKEAIRVGNLNHMYRTNTQKTTIPPKVNAQGGGSIKPRLEGAQTQEEFAKAFRAK